MAGFGDFVIDTSIPYQVSVEQCSDELSLAECAYQDLTLIGINHQDIFYIKNDASSADRTNLT